MRNAKSFEISKYTVMDAYRKVRENKGTFGVDDVSLEQFEVKLKANLYKIWNRMSSGSYFPPPVKLVEIPKKGGGKRALGIPTVADRIAQTVIKILIEKDIDKIFHKDSYAYRPNKSAIEAVGKAKESCFEYYWIIDLDIEGFFDNIDHELMMKAVNVHVKEKWMIMYIERWLKAPMQNNDKEVIQRTKGTPQGGVISPLLANLYLHYAFDRWITETHPHIKFERYADDIIMHCVSEEQAKYIRDKVAERLKECKLSLNKGKTKIVYCKGMFREGKYKNEKFDFLGFTFQPRSAKTKDGKIITSFQPAISNKAAKNIRKEIRKWRIHLWTNMTIEEIAKQINPQVRGWINYYGKYYKSKLSFTFYKLNSYLQRWVFRKYKNFKNQQWEKANDWLARIANQNVALFAHWKENFKPIFG